MEYCPFSAHKLSINILWFFSTVFLIHSYPPTKSPSVDIYCWWWSPLMWFSFLKELSDFNFPENHYNYYLLIVMASTICKPSWWIVLSPSSRSSEWLQVCILWLFCPSHSLFQLAFLPMHSLFGVWAEKGRTQKGLNAEAWGKKQ